MLYLDLWLCRNGMLAIVGSSASCFGNASTSELFFYLRACAIAAGSVLSRRAVYFLCLHYNKLFYCKINYINVIQKIYKSQEQR